MAGVSAVYSAGPRRATAGGKRDLPRDTEEAMSERNLEIVRSVFDRWGTDYWREVISHDVVWDVSAVPFAGLAGVYKGHDGLQRFFRRWLGPWNAPSVELVEIAASNDAVFTAMRWRARGRSSGAEVEQLFFGVYELKDGVIVHFRQLETRDEALQVAGLQK